MKISHKVPLIATAIIISAFAGFATYEFMQIKNNLYKQTESSINTTSKALSSEVTNWLNQRLAIVDGMSDYISADFSREKVIEAMSPKRFNDDFELFFGALDIDGKPISNKPDYNPQGWDGRQRPWWPVAKKHQRAVMTAPYVGHSSKKLLISAVANIYDGQRSVGAFGGDIDLASVSKAVNTITFDGKGYAFLLDETGKIITHPKNTFFDKNIKQLFTGKVPSLRNSLQHTNIGNQSVLVSFTPLEKFKGSEKKWLIGVVMDEKMVLEPAYRLGINAIIAAIIAAVLSSIIFYLFMNQSLIKPVARLTAQSDEISKGKLTDVIEGTERQDEIGDLANSIQRLQKSLRMAMDRIRKK